MIRHRLTVNREGVAEAQPFWSARQPQESELRRERPPGRGRPAARRLNRLLVVFLGHQRRQFAFVRREVVLEAREDVLQTWLAAADRGGQTQTNDQVDGKEVSRANHRLAGGANKLGAVSFLKNRSHEHFFVRPGLESALRERIGA